jgi:hypothetical protein
MRKRDEHMNISAESRRKSRADIPTPVVAPGANAWEQGIIPQFMVEDLGDTAGRAIPNADDE